MSWPLVNLASLGEIYAGGTPSRSNQDYWGDGIKWLSIRDYKDFDLVVSTKEQITKEGLRNSSAKLFCKDSVIISIFATLGRVAILGEDMATNQAIAAIKCYANIDNKYLMYCLKSKLSDIEKQSGGVAQKNINLSILKGLKIPLPPLETQKQIAAVLEKADQLRKDCKLLEQELNSLAQSVFIEMFGDPVTNLKGWETKTLDSLAKVQIGPFGSQLHKEDYISDGIPLINPTHIIKGQIVPNLNLTLTLEKFESLPNYHLKSGDIIMGRRGEMGRTALVDDSSKGWFCGTGSLYIRPKSKLIQPVYLNSVMSCSSMKSWLEEQSLGATMPNLNKKILHSIQVPIPSEALQTKYTLALNVLKNEHLAHKQHSKELDLLFSALMQKAFNGELNLDNANT
ncbi:restriction endonuclease subunit S [Shewanella sp. SR43-4]|uniref:restriction endonuclease subunit S n=1 Tax=Shewanella sp. SR43-4 TaxID=2760942 RepID=UPI0015FD4DDD|nr:restriction endonuclease subunit S [Shewanella sp. SR43-4]MBB1317338.1 restriction endonuclease subunit S [Shewanella sp. SR43-4]